ncbi:MAG: ThiF family adenylyltransferase [Gemmatimonadota bacterium]
MALNALIAGGGAIGNGIVAVLLELPISGRVVLIDRQAFGWENLGTCILLGRAGVTRDKVEVLAEFLRSSNSSLHVVPLSGEVANLTSKIQRNLTAGPTIVLNGFDNRDARRAVQNLWADVTIDGAIGDFMTQVSRHPGDPEVDIACLRCLNAPDTGLPADVVASQATGLSIERVRDINDVVRQEDVDNAPPEHRESLATKVGRKICAVTSVATVAKLSMEEQHEEFEPSVPFVATMSAAMVVAEMVKYIMRLRSPLAPRFQFDILRGPSFGLEFAESRHITCDCSTRRSAIQRFRQLRHAS